MRRSLLNSFNVIYLLNLHGSVRREEAVPNGEKDENVFDIQQGVCILLCVKKRDNSASTKAYYADMWGSQAEKYRTLSETDVQSTGWSELQPTSPYYLFVPQTTAGRKKYEEGWEIPNIFQTSTTGIVTGRDKFTLYRSPADVHQVVTDFVALTEDKARQKYNLPKDSAKWTIKGAQADIRNHPDIEAYIVPMCYRLFDTRFTYYTGKPSGFHRNPSYSIMRHLVTGENLALCLCPGTTSRLWQHAFVTQQIVEKSSISNKTGSAGHVFPLYLHPNSEELELATERSINLKPKFLKTLSKGLRLSQTEPSGLPQGVLPEEILGYIYAILYSPTYRERYNEFLKYGFPRIPLPSDIEHFRKLAELGQSLVNWHLLNGVQVLPRYRFEGEGDAVVSRVRYEGGHVWINPTQHFTDVPIEVWEYEIGAYQVCEKWLKDRRGSALSHAEVRQYCAILVTISETLRIMGDIDAVMW